MTDTKEKLELLEGEIVRATEQIKVIWQDIKDLLEGKTKEELDTDPLSLL